MFEGISDMIPKQFFPSVFPGFMPISYRLKCALCALVVLCFSAPVTNAEERYSEISPDQMEKPLEKALESHGAELEELKSHRKRLEKLREKIQAEIDFFRSLYIAHSQLLLESQPRIETFENAIDENRLALGVIDEHFEDLEDPIKSISDFNLQTTDRIELVQEQIEELRDSRLSAARKKLLEEAALEVLQVLEEKKQLGEQLQVEYRELLNTLKDGMEAKKAINQKLKARLEILKRTSLIKRFDPLRDVTANALAEEIKWSIDRVKSVFISSTWEVLWARSKLGGSEKWAFFFGGLLLIIAVQRPLRRVLMRIEAKCEGPEASYRKLAAYLIRHSLPFLCLTFFFGIYYFFRFFGIYKSFQFSLFNIGLERVLFLIFLILTTTQWGLEYLRLATVGSPKALRSFVCLKLGWFFRFFRTVLIVGIILVWIAGTGTLISWILRVLASAVALLWTVFFWRGFRRVLERTAREEHHAIPDRKWIAYLRAWSFLVVGGSLALNLLGYRSLGGRWFISWADTTILLFWGWIGLNAFNEWGRDLSEKTGDKLYRPEKSSRHFRWSLFQFFRAAFLLIVAAAIIRVWDPAGILSAHLVDLFGFTLAVGSLQVGVKGILFAGAIIFATLVGARFGRALIKEKVLDKKSLERGLEDSILTITTYLIWALGILLALGTLGVDAGSLAVVFGALSIGIGFGLQNIFNNFISGLILLFERPVQVGDYVEIDGVWAEVKKINVRATVVQTLDNASMIIPNSDFISRQVTNWSFKDKRIRRNMEVGVAYGSDIELVMNTLMEIAEKDTNVLKYPKPEILFVDHADSALIFRIRFWIDLENYWTATSRIRCEIDRRFRELAIEIAFPQRDLHIRSVPKDFVPADLGEKHADHSKFEDPEDQMETVGA